MANPPARAVLALAAVLLAAGPLAPPMALAGPASQQVGRFSDGSTEVSVYFPQSWEPRLTGITLPRNAFITSASLSVKGLSDSAGARPSLPQLDIGGDGSPEWSFGNELGSGELGRQMTFSNGRSEVEMQFPAGGGEATTAILLPAGADITTASASLAGDENPLPTLRTLSSFDAAPFIAWTGDAGRHVVAAVIDGALRIVEQDPDGGNRTALDHPLPAGSQVVDFQTAPAFDSAAFLVPGRGVVVADLAAGTISEHFTDGRAHSLTAMKHGGSFLAGAGQGWASLVDLSNGSERAFTGADTPALSRGMPIAVDYHPPSRALFIAWGAVGPVPGVTVLDLDDLTVRTFQEEGARYPPDSLAVLPDGRSVLLGYGSGRYGSSNTHNYPVTVRRLDLDTGAFSNVSAFAGLNGADRLEVAGGRVTTLAWNSGGRTLVRLELDSGSLGQLPVQLPFERQVRWWSFDHARQELLASSDEGALWLLDLGNRSAWPLPGLDSPVPPGVRTARQAGERLLLGTERGVAAVDASGGREWLADCGAVTASALDPSGERLAAGAMEGWVLDANLGAWRFSRARMSVLELGEGPPRTASWQVELLPEWHDSAVTAVAFLPGGNLSFGLAGKSTAGGLFVLNTTTGQVHAWSTPSPAVTSLAATPDGSLLFVGLGGPGGGLLRLELGTGNRTFLSTGTTPALLGPQVNSLSLDASGLLLVGQGNLCPGLGYCIGGATSLDPRDLSGVKHYHAPVAMDAGSYDVRCAVRDPERGRILLGLGNFDGLLALDERDRSPSWLGGPGTALEGGSIRDLSWCATSRRLVGALAGQLGRGAGFSLRWTGGLPENVTIDLGADGSPEWTFPGRFEGASLELRSLLEDRLSTSEGAGLVEVPLRLGSSGPGALRLRSLAVTYELSVRVDIGAALRAQLASRPAGGEAAVPVRLSGRGGGLALFDLDVRFEPDTAPRAAATPRLKADAGALAPTVVDLGGYIQDDHDPPGDLGLAISRASPPAGVKVEIRMGHYLHVDARGTAFRGNVPVTINVTDSSGLSAEQAISIEVVRTGEYIPPPPAYSAFLLVSFGVIASLGVLAAFFYYRSSRKGQ